MSDSSELNRFNPRPVTGGSRNFGIRYPSPFFDVAQQFLPDNVHQLHLWCRYYFLTNPIINAAVSKMAEYPVTPLIYDSDNPAVQELYSGLEKHLKLRQFQVEVGLDYYTYGSSFVSIAYPFIKFLICKWCHTRYRAEKNRSLYRWKNQRFFLNCPGCRAEDYAKEQDVYIRSVRDIRLVRWNPENIEIQYNEVTGASKYYFKMPKGVVNDVKVGDRDAIETLPLEFIEAARENKALIFDSGNFYHLKRPTLAQKDQGWGTPLLYPVLKDAFYLQVMKKAQEALMMDHVIPLRVVYPGQNTGGNDGAYGAYNLSNWKAKIDSELNIWKRDHNYIPILPVNVGFQHWGGQAKALILHQEFRLFAEQMLAGMGIPTEFVFGGLQWSGTNTSLRALENMFTGYNGQRHELINDFVIGNIAAYMKWPKVKARFDRFKMADDLQRSMFMFQLNQAQKISDRRLLEDLGENIDTETERMGEELKRQLSTQRKSQVATANIQGEAMLHTSRYQAKATKLQTIAQMEGQMEAQAAMGGMPGQEMAPPGGEMPAPPVPGEEQAPADASAPMDQKLPVAMSGMQSPLTQGAGGVDLRYVAQRAVSYLNTIKDEQGEQEMYRAMEQLQLDNPQLYRLVVQLKQDTGSKENPMNALKKPTPAGNPQADVSRQIG